jgi:hypothetical protein
MDGPGIHPADGLVLAREEDLTSIPVPAARQNQLCNPSTINDITVIASNLCTEYFNTFTYTD